MLEGLKEEVWKLNLELPKHNLVVWTSGNVSGRDFESRLVVIKPSGVPYEELTPRDLVVVNLDGQVVEGDLQPSVDSHPSIYLSPSARCGGRGAHSFAVRHQFRGSGPPHPRLSNSDRR